MNKIVIGAVTAVVVGVGAAAGWYFIGKESGPSVASVGSAPALDCAGIKANVDATLAALPPEVKATYSGLECAGAKLTFAELRFGFLGGGGVEDSALKLSGLVIDDAFAANAKTVFNAASYPQGQAPGTAALPLAGKITAVKVAIGPASGGGIAFDNLDISDLASRQFGKAPPATLAELGALGPAGLADVLQAFSFSAFTFKNLTGGPADAVTPGATKTVLSIASVGLSAFDGKTLGGLDVASITATPDAGSGKVSFGSIGVKGLGVADLAALATSAANMGMGDETSMGVKALLSITAESATVKAFEAAGLDDPKDRIKFASISVEQLKALAFSKLTLEGLEGVVSASDVFFSLDKLTLAGIDIGSALKPLETDPNAEPDFSKMRADAYDLAGLKVGPVEGARVELASLTARSSDYVDGIATRGSASLKSLVFPAAIIPEGDRQPLTDLGYDALKFDASTDYAFDPKTKTMDLKDFTLKLVDGGALTLKFNFSNFDIQALQAAAQSFEPPAALLASKVTGASLSYKDDTLIGRALKLIAKEQGATEDALIEQAKGFIQMQIAAAPGPVTKAALEGALAFVNSRKGVTITLAPPAAVSFGELAGLIENVEGAAAALGLTVKAD
ncbi:hypothetical protein [Zavarzinia compransoris]|uniref:Uncharacterized protein n=1 Tax=Zavarzinia compransoris TaxID=1264899 RepID=A0A317DXW0_9PROT|nr:hypothetical protein [Zavarzinia compransoris]PWR19567.1 hypothetical protein DKG75_13905 [Zavarzinia compransoris]TDP40452.1 hypothetical protein DES42_11474 [Zavarzinia compransoris]